MSVRYVLAPQAAVDLIEIWRYIKEWLLDGEGSAGVGLKLGVIVFRSYFMWSS
jgi:hypothetical protein